MSLLLGSVLAVTCMSQIGYDRRIDWVQAWRVFVSATVGLQIILGFYGAFMLTANSIGMEKTLKTHEFLVTLPLSGIDKLLGLALGKNLNTLMVLIALTPIAGASWLGAGLNFADFLWLEANIFIAFIAGALVGVSMSGRGTGGPLAWILMLIVAILGVTLVEGFCYSRVRFAPLLAISPFSILAFCMNGVDRTDYLQNCLFYGTPIPWQLCPMALLALFAVAGTVLGVKVFSRPSEPRMPRPASLLFTIVLMVLLVGFSKELGGRSYRVPLVWQLGISVWTLATIWGIAAMPRKDAIVTWLRQKPFWAGRMIWESLYRDGSPTHVFAATLGVICTAGLMASECLYGDAGLRASECLYGDAGLRASECMYGDNGLPFAWELLVVMLVQLVFLLAYLFVFLAGRLMGGRGRGPLGLIFLIVVVLLPLAFSTAPGCSFVRQATPYGVITDGLYHDWRPDHDFGRISLISLGCGLGLMAVFASFCAIRMHALRHRHPRHDTSVVTEPPEVPARL